MTVKTIGVEIKGENDVLRVSKLVDKLKESVKEVEKTLKGGKGGRPSLFIEVGVSRNSLIESANQISRFFASKDFEINVQPKVGKLNGASSNLSKQANSLIKSELTENSINSFNRLGDSIDDSKNKLARFYGMLGKSALDAPVKGLLSGFKLVGREVTSLIGKVNRLTGSLLGNALQNGFYAIANRVGEMARSVIAETKEIGDALVTYKIQMKQMGLSDKEINTNLKTLTEFGKASVFDASDLIQQAGDYQAYGMSSKGATDLVKAIGGMTAQTADPNKSIEHVGIQLKDMMARQKVTWQDVKFMKGWFNAQGSAKLSEILDKKAMERGYKNTIDAITKGAMTPEDITGAINEVGLSDSFQKLVTTIATPKQAIDNLKEALANQFQVGQYDNEGNVIEAPLNNLYKATVTFIKEITSLVNTSTFAKGVRQVGDDLSKVINSTIRLGKYLGWAFGGTLIDSISKFYNEAKRGIGDVDGFTKSVSEFVREVISFNNSNGRALGENFAILSKTVVNALKELTVAGNNLISGGMLKGVNEYFKAWLNLGKLANNSGAVKEFATQFTNLFSIINNVLTNRSVNSNAKKLISSIGELLDGIFSIINKIAVSGGGISSVIGIVTTIVKAVSGVAKSINTKVSTSDVKSFFSNLSVAVSVLVKGLEEVAKAIVPSLIKTLASNEMGVFMMNIAEFIVAVGQMVQTALSGLGFGSTEQGLKNILKVVNLATSFVTELTKLISNDTMLSIATIAFLAWTFKVKGLVTEITEFIGGLVGMKGLKALTGGGKALAGAEAVAGGVGGVSLAKGLANTAKATLLQKGISNAIKSGDLVKMAKYEKALAGISGATFGATKIAKNATALSNGIKTFSTSFKEVGLLKTLGSTTKAVGGMSKAFTGIGGLVAGLGGDYVNNKVQKSNASSGVKQLSGIANGALQGGTMGAMIGSFIAPVIGTAIGGGIGALGGAIMAEFSRQSGKVAKVEASKQVNALARQKSDFIISQAEQIAEESKSLYEGFSNALFMDKNSTWQEDLNNVVSYIQGVSQTTGQSITQSMKSIGLNAVAIPENIDGMFVELNGQLVNWAELKSQTGLNDEQLMGALEQLKRSVGEKTVNLVNEQGQLIQSYAVETEASAKDRESQFNNFKEYLNNLGIAVGNVSLEAIKSTKDDLQRALDGANFATNEERIAALKEAISSATGTTMDSLAGKTQEELEAMARSVQEGMEETIGTPQERNAKALKAYRKYLEDVLKLSDEKVEEKLKEASGKTLEGIEQEMALTKEENSKKNKKAKANNGKASILAEQLSQIETAVNDISKAYIQDNIAKINTAVAQLGNADPSVQARAGEDMKAILKQLGIKDKELQDKVISNIRDKGMTFQEAINALSTDTDKNGKTKQEQLEAVKASNQAYFDHVLKMVEDGKLTIDQGAQALAGVDMSTIDTTGPGTKAEELKQKTQSVINKSGTKLNTASKKASSDFSWVSYNAIVSGMNLLGQTIQSAIDAAGKALENATGISFGGGNKKRTKKKADGGIIRRALGGSVPSRFATGGINWQPIGTDTVPAMLTPGEYVLRKKAVDSLGENFLNKLNSRGAQALQNTSNRATIYNVYNNNNAQITQNVDNKSQYLNSMQGIDKLMRYV